PLDEGRHDLAVVVVGQADHRGTVHSLLSEQAVLHLARVDVLAAPDDHVGGAPADADHAPLVDGGQVAGTEPAVGVDRRGRGRRIPEVLQQGVTAAGVQLAQLPRGALLAGMRVPGADLDARQRAAAGLYDVRHRVAG